MEANTLASGSSSNPAHPPTAVQGPSAVNFKLEYRCGRPCNPTAHFTTTEEIAWPLHLWSTMDPGFVQAVHKIIDKHTRSIWNARGFKCVNCGDRATVIFHGEFASVFPQTSSVATPSASITAYVMPICCIKSRCERKVIGMIKDSQKAGMNPCSPEMPKCQVCQNKVAALLCWRCLGKGYCSEECQDADWPIHCLACAERPKDMCAACGLFPMNGKCGSCRMVGYCSAKCRDEDWPVHCPKCTPNPTAVCNICGSIHNIQMCGGCAKIGYCSDVCRDLHWPRHRHECGLNPISASSTGESISYKSVHMTQIVSTTTALAPAA